MSVKQLRCCFAFLALATLALCPQMLRAGEQPSPNSPQDVLTYHNDNNRSGWFSAETILTPAIVGSSAFGLQKVIATDGRIDAEPLFVSSQSIDGKGVHDVIYVATENNSVYACDAASGAILWHRQYGLPVPDAYKSGDDNVYPVMGILSTPVIDRAAGLMYFVSDSFSAGTDDFRLHAVSLSNGRDAVPPAVIQYSETLADGTLWNFNPQYQLQRPALLEANGSIYVAFGSNGDIVPSISRGTILRYDATTLLPMTGQLTDRLTQPQSSYYLSSIWQSGFGPVADAGGDIFFSTGNSDPSTPSYSQAFNRPDSMVRLSADLATLKDSFTTYNYFSLDQGDADMGSGGLMILPDQLGALPHLAIAGGKDGRAFLLNRDNMGGYTPGGPDNVVQTINMGSCWCGPSYYVGSDNVVHIITGGGNGVTSWKLRTSPTTQLVQEGSTGQSAVNGLPDDGGTMPVVSSNGTTAGTAVVWFVQRPSTSSDVNPGTPVTLRAYAATNLSHPLLSILGGTWTHAENSNANLVPTIAKGRVYVVSNMQLRIYGLRAHPGSAALDPITPSLPQTIACPAGIAPAAAVNSSSREHEVYGTVCRARGTELTLALRNGRSVTIETGTALNQHRPVLLTAGRPLHVSLTIDKAGTAHAHRVAPTHMITAQTPSDR